MPFPPPGPHADTQPRNETSIESEVRANILAQPIIRGEPTTATVADLNLPEALIDRVADRIIRSTFLDRHRAIFDDRPHNALHSEPPHADTLVDRENWHPLRGYRPPLVPSDTPWPDSFPSPGDPPELRRAAVHVAQRLASDALPATLAQACTILAPLLRDAAPEARLHLLRRAGLPTDLFDFFTIDGAPLLAHLCAQLEAGRPTSTDRARFNFRPSLPGFRAIDEAGSDTPALCRMQLTRPDHWNPALGGGPNSGDNFDLLLHLLRELPTTPFFVSIHSRHVDAFRVSLARAGIDAARVTIFPVPLAVSQWAQDNLKTGLVDSTPAVLFPRFASRAEDGAKVDPGDTAALTSLPPGIPAAHSPLHFQGGNVLLINRPGAGRLLLIGEAEIARNVTLGLTPAQAEDALRIEMGADSSLVLPAVGFHLDTELTARTVNAETLVFVPDQEAAARIIIRASLRALEHARILTPPDTRALLAFLDLKNDEQLVSRLGGLLAQISDSSGNLPRSFAEVLRLAAPDSGSANALRLLAALDIIAALRPRPWEPSLHPHAQAYFRSLRRAAADRDLLADILARHALRVVPLPSLTAGVAGNRSASLINAVHLPARSLFPAHPGLFKPLDDAALRVLRTHLDDSIELRLLPAAESERRGGAIHCSLSLLPAPPPHNPNQEAPSLP